MLQGITLYLVALAAVQPTPLCKAQVTTLLYTSTHIVILEIFSLVNDLRLKETVKIKHSMI